MIDIRISREDDHFLADVKSWPGSPSVGRGQTMMAALGDWLHHNRDKVGVSIAVAPNAEPAEKRRQARELKKR